MQGNADMHTCVHASQPFGACKMYGGVRCTSVISIALAVFFHKLNPLHCCCGKGNKIIYFRDTFVINIRVINVWPPMMMLVSNTYTASISSITLLLLWFVLRK